MLVASSPFPADAPLDRAELLRRLRRLLPALEGRGDGEGRPLPLGIPEIDRHLPAGGLALGVLHEAAPQGYADLPAAFGFAMALAGCLARAREGPLFLVAARNGLADWGGLYGGGLTGLGLDPGRLILVEAGGHEDALWAIEEILRARAALCVLGCLAEGLSLKASRRLQLAAGGGDALALILRPHDAEAANAASTRWRIAAAPSGRDRFGLVERWGFDVTLDRARNGRPGAWRVEFDHVAYRFGLARELADQPLPRLAEERPPAARRGAG